MANILQSRFCNTLVACITTVAFTTATLTPPPLMAEWDASLKDCSN